MNHPNRSKQQQAQHTPPFVQRERRNGMNCYVLTAAQYQTLQDERAELLTALKAIRARIDGVYDNPALVSQGPLSTDIGLDCARYADTAIAKAEGR